PALNYNGSGTVTVTVSDGNLTGSTDFTLTVNPVNDAPDLGVLSDANVAEDNTFTLALSASDVDGDALTFLASVDGNGSASVSGTTLSVTPDLNYNGDIEVTVTASDGQASGSGSFTLTVTAVNDAPVMAAIDDQVIDEDNSLTLTLSASDVDGDALTYSAVDGGATVDINGTTLTLTPALNYNGSGTVTVTVSDGSLTSSTDFTLTVNPVNDDPDLGTLSDANIAEDNTFTLELNASDVDGDALTFSASVDGNGSASVSGTTLSVTPDLNYNGTILVSILA
ncbi:uncharacterized protein METZ01_LOCUS405575, partial [marine metagenome]